MRRFAFLIPALLLPLPALATDLTTVLNPGFIKLEADVDYNLLSLLRPTASRETRFEQTQYIYPLRAHYGLAQGVELAFTLPLSARILSSSSEQSLVDRAWQGVGDLEGGTKFKFLSDTMDTPAIFVESLLKIPTGHSRFRDYVRALDDPAFPISGTDTATYDLILKGIFSLFLDPMEMFLQLRIDVRGADDFRQAGRHEHIDYGNVVSLSGGVEWDLLDTLTLALQAAEISTEASVWLRDGQNALALAPDSSLLMAAARTQAGVSLGNTTELYVGPALTWTFLPSTSLTASVQLGLTPDSSAVRATAGFATAFPVGALFDFRRGFPLLPRREPPASPAIADLPGPVAVEEAPEEGNRRRFFKRHQDRAQQAREQGNLSLAISELKRILLEYPDDAATLAAVNELRAELDAAVQPHAETAALALRQNHLLGAVRSWREILRLDPGNAAALGMLRDYDQAIRDEARALYLQGLDAYVKADYDQAVSLWQQAQVFDPASPKLRDSINQTRRKQQQLERIAP
ncbi:MAG: hypothetical protein AB1439_08055 [candidate division FCPU426 bacterium]